MTFHNVSVFNKSGIEVDRFQTMSDAITYIERHSLGADWATPSLPDQHTEDDELLLLAFSIRAALRPHWRHAQFDRLMSREITHLPDQNRSDKPLPSHRIGGGAAGERRLQSGRSWART